ncbi:MAG: fused response regulator/phosphatase [Desulfobacteraceae bacterium]|nr:fused response regulator/phosphatase [Desulfobacteraceae bacterium]
MDDAQVFTVLVVDDNLLNLKLIEKTLEKEGYRVVSAIDGPKGRALAAKEGPDLILLDIEMPGEDGFEVIQHLKDNPETSTIPVIFLTGVIEVSSKLQGFKLGAVDYITKPFHPLEVLARVSIHLKLSIATNSLISDQAQKLKQVTDAQTSMLPLPDDIPEACFGVYYEALQEAGGDFYDILEISNKITGYFLADFSGHDIETSYMTASVKALLAQNCTPIYSPSESMKMINDVLVEILPEGKYLTACYMHINRGTKKMILLNAGHPPVVHIPFEKEAYLIKSKGDILGMFKDAQFGRQDIDIAEKDKFIIFSDGLVESAEDKTTWVSGATSLLPQFEKMRDIPYKEIPDKLIKQIFSEDVIWEDDIAVLCVEI